MSTTSVSVASQASAQAAVSAVQAAISTVASIEANVGATQNQLAVVVANLTVGQQNLQSAYSGLVDVNFAQETTTFTTDQILMQSGISMLSQAQQTPSLVLKLLRLVRQRGLTPRGRQPTSPGGGSKTDTRLRLEPTPDRTLGRAVLFHDLIEPVVAPTLEQGGTDDFARRASTAANASRSTPT